MTDLTIASRELTLGLRVLTLGLRILFYVGEPTIVLCTGANPRFEGANSGFKDINFM